MRLLDNRKAILFVRGERPVLDDKFDVLRHPNKKHTTDGGAPLYRHGEDTLSYASFTVDLEALMQCEESFEVNGEFELVSGKKLEHEFNII